MQEKATTVSASDQDQMASRLDTLFRKVYLPVFMSKLSARHWPVSSEAELEEALKMAVMSKLHTTAADGVSPFAKAASALEAVTLAPAQNPASPDPSEFLRDPEVAEALKG